MKRKTITPQFVDKIPDHLEEGVLYICEKYSTAMHKCCCGCGEEVVTPLNAAGWKILRKGKAVSMTPSIGSWDSKCQSHYFIVRNQIEWAHGMSERQIRLVKDRDKVDNQRLIARNNALMVAKQTAQKKQEQPVRTSSGFWHNFLRWIGLEK